MSMDDISMIKERLKHIKRRFSRKSSYDVGFNAPKFKVKALCSEGVSVESLERETSNEAVDNALGMVGSLENKNKNDVVLKISLRNGIEIISRKTRKELLSYRIHQVGYCNVDKRYPQVFVFTAAKTRDALKCHIFLCDDAAKAKAICLTLAKVFQSSFSNWQKSKDMDDDLNHNNINLPDRRQSVDVIQSRPVKRAEMRRASDFVTTSSSGYLAPKHLDVRRSSYDTHFQHASSDDESYEEDVDMAYQEFLSKSVEKGTCSLLRRGSTDWDAFEGDSEIQRKMQGDLIVWED